MNVGLIGFGKAGRAVASVLLESEATILQWVVRSSRVLEHRSVPEFLGVSSDEPGWIHSKEEFSADDLFNESPVDAVIDFSAVNGLDYYGEAAAKRGITIVSAISHYPEEQLAKLRSLAEKTVVMHSPNITIGVNFMIIAAKILKNIAPYTDIEIVEEHFKNKPEVSGTAKIIARELALPMRASRPCVPGALSAFMKSCSGFPTRQCA